MKKKNDRGFTLIELLAVISILALVLSITMYSVTSIIRNAKEKTYLTTINEVEEAAGNYILENSDDLFFIKVNNDNTKEYNCIMVKELIDYGFLNNDVIKSQIDNDGNTINSGNYVYVERNINTKTIQIKKYIIGDENNFYNSLCVPLNLLSGYIQFDINPIDWSRSKNVDITYRIKNVSSLNKSNYKYGYEYNYDDSNYNDPDGPIKSDDAPNSIDVTVKEKGKMYGYIQYKNEDDSEKIEKTQIISKFDNIGPKIELIGNDTKRYVNSNDNVVKISLKITDCENEKECSGLKEYNNSNLKKKITDNKVWVKVGDTLVSSDELSLTNKGNGEYELKIEPKNKYNGEVIIHIDKDTFVDKTVDEPNGNGKFEEDANILFDTIAPTIEFAMLDNSNNTEVSTDCYSLSFDDNIKWFNFTPKLKFIGSDDGSGLEEKATLYWNRLNSGRLDRTISGHEDKIWNNGVIEREIDSNGYRYLYLNACDRAGNCTKREVYFKFDNVGPNINVQLLNGTTEQSSDYYSDSSTNNIKWFKFIPKLKFIGSDSVSGLETTAELHYNGVGIQTLNEHEFGNENHTWEDGVIEKKISSDGYRYLYLHACDEAGNCTDKKIYFKFDKTAPSKPNIENNNYNNTWCNAQHCPSRSGFPLNLSTTESLSGVAYWQYTYNENADETGNDNDTQWVTYGNSASENYTTTEFTKERNQYVYIRACDNAGNCSEKSKTMIMIDRTPPTINISSTSNLLVTRQTLTLTCDDTNGIGGYYINTQSPGDNAVFTSNNTQTITNQGTYFAVCKDSAGNVSNIRNQKYWNYTIKYMLANVGGTEDIYSTENYQETQSNTYLMTHNETIDFDDITKSVPAGSSTDKYKGVSELPSSGNATLLSNNSSKVDSQKTYAFWYNRNNVNFKIKIRSGETFTQSTDKDGVTYSWSTDSNGYLKLNNNIYKKTIKYGTSSMNLPDPDNEKYIFITKTGYIAVPNAEWVCINGCKTENQKFSKVYSSIATNDICDASKRDCTVDLSVNWQANKVNVKYNVNGGTWRNENNHNSNLSILDNGLVERKDLEWQIKTILQRFDYGGVTGTNGLVNYNNSDSLDIVRSGYSIPSGKEWYKVDSNGTKRYFNQTGTLNANDLCVAENGNCTVTLYANWQPNTSMVELDGNGATTRGTQKVYVKTDAGIYLDSGYTKLMTGNSNNITLPTKTGYKFNGYYDDNNVQMINDTGFKTSNFKESDYRSGGTITAKWVPNKVNFKYKVRSDETLTPSSKCSLSGGYVKCDDSIIIHSMNYGTQIGGYGLKDYNNTSYINISKTGYRAVSGEEWKCVSGCTTSNKTFSQADKTYTTDDFCNAGNGDCTVELAVNWGAYNILSPIFKPVINNVVQSNISSNVWTNKKYDLQITSNNTANVTLKYKVNNGSYNNYSSELKPSEGVTNYVAKAVIGNSQSSEVSYIAKIDTTPPKISRIDNPTNGNCTNTNFALTIHGSDGEGSGIRYYQYSYDQSNWTTYNNSSGNKYITTNFSNERNEYVYIRARDYAGNYSDPVRTYICIDKTPPSITFSMKNGNESLSYGTSSSSSVNWINKVPTLTYNVTDSRSGVSSKGTIFWNNPGNYGNYNESITGNETLSGTEISNGYKFQRAINSDGFRYIKFKVSDVAGNSTTYNVYFKLDKTVPNIQGVILKYSDNSVVNSDYYSFAYNSSLPWFTFRPVIRWTATDSASGINSSATYQSNEPGGQTLEGDYTGYRDTENRVTANINGSNYIFTVGNGNGISGGYRKFKIKVCDVAGNCAENPIYFKYYGNSAQNMYVDVNTNLLCRTGLSSSSNTVTSFKCGDIINVIRTYSTSSNEWSYYAPKNCYVKGIYLSTSKPNCSSGSSSGSSSSGGSSGSAGGCFLKGTKVKTIYGFKNIEQIVAGDLVLSYNEETHKNEYKSVEEVFIHKKNMEYLYSLTIDNKVLKVTGVHRFYIKRNNELLWLSANKLKVGDMVKYANGTYHKITNISYSLQTNTVYNLMVADNHNYYVSNEMILVHNAKDDVCISDVCVVP